MGGELRGRQTKAKGLKFSTQFILAVRNPYAMYLFIQASNKIV